MPPITRKTRSRRRSLRNSGAAAEEENVNEPEQEAVPPQTRSTRRSTRSNKKEPNDDEENISDEEGEGNVDSEQRTSDQSKRMDKQDSEDFKESEPGIDDKTQQESQQRSTRSKRRRNQGDSGYDDDGKITEDGQNGDESSQQSSDKISTRLSRRNKLRERHSDSPDDAKKALFEDVTVASGPSRKRHREDKRDKNEGGDSELNTIDGEKDENVENLSSIQGVGDREDADESTKEKSDVSSDASSTGTPNLAKADPNIPEKDNKAHIDTSNENDETKIEKTESPYAPASIATNIEGGLNEQGKTERLSKKRKDNGEQESINEDSPADTLRTGSKKQKIEAVSNIDENLKKGETTKRNAAAALPTSETIDSTSDPKVMGSPEVSSAEAEASASLLSLLTGVPNIDNNVHTSLTDANEEANEQPSKATPDDQTTVESMMLLAKTVAKLADTSADSTPVEAVTGEKKDQEEDLTPNLNEPTIKEVQEPDIPSGNQKHFDDANRLQQNTNFPGTFTTKQDVLRNDALAEAPDNTDETNQKQPLAQDMEATEQESSIVEGKDPSEAERMDEISKEKVQEKSTDQRKSESEPNFQFLKEKSEDDSTDQANTVDPPTRQNETAGHEIVSSIQGVTADANDDKVVVKSGEAEICNQEESVSTLDRHDLESDRIEKPASKYETNLEIARPAFLEQSNMSDMAVFLSAETVAQIEATTTNTSCNSIANQIPLLPKATDTMISKENDGYASMKHETNKDVDENFGHDLNLESEPPKTNRDVHGNLQSDAINETRDPETNDDDNFKTKQKQDSHAIYDKESSSVANSSIISKSILPQESDSNIDHKEIAQDGDDNETTHFSRLPQVDTKEESIIEQHKVDENDTSTLKYLQIPDCDEHDDKQGRIEDARKTEQSAKLVSAKEGVGDSITQEPQGSTSTVYISDFLIKFDNPGFPVERLAFYDAGSVSDDATLVDEVENSPAETSKPSSYLGSLKFSLFRLGQTVHSSRGYERLFQDYWTALVLRLEANLPEAIIEKAQTRIDFFLKTKQMRRIHNKIILGIMKRSLDCAMPLSEINDQLPLIWRARINHRPQSSMKAFDSAGRFSINDYSPATSYSSPRHLRPSSTITLDDLRVPGALYVDPLVRNLAQSAGIKVSENGVSLIIVALKEYMTMIVRDSITFKSAIARGDLPPLLSSRSKAQQKRKLPAHEYSLVHSEGLPNSRVISTFDILQVLSNLPTGQVQSLGGTSSRLSFERSLYSSFDRNLLSEDASFRKVHDFFQSRLIPVAPTTKQSAKPRSSDFKDIERRSPGGMGRGAKDLAALKARTGLSKMNTGPSNAEEKESKGDSVLAQVTVQEPIDKSVTSRDISRLSEKSNLTDQKTPIPPAREHVSSPIASAPASPAPDTSPRTQMVTPSRRGKGFGVKNLAAMRARSVPSKPSIEIAEPDKGIPDTATHSDTMDTPNISNVNKSVVPTQNKLE